MGRLVIIGIGDPNRRDDGVGIAVVGRLRLHSRHPRPMAGAPSDEVRFAVSGGEPTSLADLWANAAVAVVINCVRVREPTPGRIHRRSLLNPLVDGRRVASSHGSAVSDALSLSASLDLLPDALVLYSVEPADTSAGRGLTPAVAASAAGIAEEIAKDFIPA